MDAGRERFPPARPLIARPGLRPFLCDRRRGLSDGINWRIKKCSAQPPVRVDQVDLRSVLHGVVPTRPVGQSLEERAVELCVDPAHGPGIPGEPYRLWQDRSEVGLHGFRAVTATVNADHDKGRPAQLLVGRSHQQTQLCESGWAHVGTARKPKKHQRRRAAELAQPEGLAVLIGQFKVIDGLRGRGNRDPIRGGSRNGCIRPSRCAERACAGPQCQRPARPGPVVPSGLGRGGPGMP